MSSGAEAAVIPALEEMRSGLLIALVGWILMGIGLVAIIFGLFTAMGPGMPWLFPLSLLVSIVLVILGDLVLLIGIYTRFVPGVRTLAHARPEFGTASTLVRVGYVGGLILILVGAVLSIVLIGIPLFIIGLVLLLLGHIGVALLSFKMHDAYRNSLYLVAGILVLLSIVFPILAVITCILLYVALGDTIKELKSRPAP